MVVNAIFLFEWENRLLRKVKYSYWLLPAQLFTLLLCFGITNGVRLNSVCIFTLEYID